MKMEVQIEPTIAKILRNFDFAKVHAVMLHLGWTWGSDGRSRIPSVEELRTKAEEMLRGLDPTKEYHHIRTGGLLASACRGKEIRLVFELAQASEQTPEPQLALRAA